MHGDAPQLLRSLSCRGHGRALEEAVHSRAVNAGLLELERLRASSLNGCSYCVDMHTRDAKGIGITRHVSLVSAVVNTSRALA